MKKLKLEEANIRCKINIAEKEITQLKKLRTAVINEYLNNNQEFDNLVNKKYETQKKLNKKG